MDSQNQRSPLTVLVSPFVCMLCLCMSFLYYFGSIGLPFVRPSLVRDPISSIVLVSVAFRGHHRTATTAMSRGQKGYQNYTID